MQSRYFYEIKDKRLMGRGNSILNRFFSNNVHSIRRLASNDSEAKAMYRFLQNDRVSEDDIIKNMSSNCVSCVGNRPVLCIQDTSDVNYNHKNRIKKDDYIGTTSAATGGLGFHIHPGFVVDAESFMPYGFSTIKIWNRSHEQPKKDLSHQKKMLPIESKESYRWIDASLKSKEALQAAREIIIIQDREGDIYEQFALVPDPKTHLLIRAKSNRILQGKQKLFEYHSSQYTSSDLKRYIWAIARLGGWKGYLSERKPGITTFWMGLQKFTSVMQGWILFRDVSRR